MKFLIAMIFASAAVTALAQQAPGAVTQPPRTGQLPGIAPAAVSMSNAEITALLRAQTAAIKALSNKLDAIDERLGKVERGTH